MNSNADTPDRPQPGALIVQSHGEEGDFERVERWQALEPGYYWTAQKDDAAHRIGKGDALLLMDIMEYEEKVHSVTLRVHPRNGEGKFSMLVAQFLDVFMPCPDADAVRQREQQEVMQRVADLQAEISRTQADPQLMIEAIRADVEKAVKAQEVKEGVEVKADEERVNERAQDLAKVHRWAARRSAAKGNPLVAPRVAMASEVGDLIDKGINETGVAELRKMAARQAIVARAQAEWLQQRTTAISKTLEQLGPYISERSAVALARASGAVKMAERIKRGIESLDLYTGKGVDVYDIRIGAEAPSTEPLTIVQGKRYAEEEYAAWADVGNEFDFRSKKEFFEAIAANDALMVQIFPTARCVVSMAMTRRDRHYGNELEQVLYNIQNHLVFLLVRNGDNVHVVYSSSPSHEGAARLFPTKDDLDAPFRGWDCERISIRDVEFGESAKRFDEMALVYRRFLILLCGLDHRMKLFGDFYPAESQMQFMSQAFQASYFRFLPDDESGWLIGDGAEVPLHTWFATKNAMLQSGSRVFVMQGRGLTANSPELKRRNSLNATDEQFATPFIAFKDAGRLVISVEAYDKWASTKYQQVKCILDGEENETREDAQWICVDGVTLDEVRRYRHSRMHRSMGIGYLRLFRRLEDYLEREFHAERDSRAYLLEAAVECGGLTRELAQSSLGTAVRNWRASRRGAALPGVDDKAALNEVLSLMVPEGHLTRPVEAMLSAYLAESGVTPLLLTRTGKAKMYLYVVPDAADKAPYPDILSWGWVRRITLEVGKTKLKTGTTSLQWLTKVLPASEVEIRRWEGLDAWLNEKDEPITLRKYGTIPARLAAAKEWEPVLRAGPGAGLPDEFFQRLFRRTREIHSANRSGMVANVYIAIPVALYSDDGRKLCVSYMSARSEHVLYVYGNQAQRDQVWSFYVNRFNVRSSGKEKLQAPFEWTLGGAEHGLEIMHDEPVKDGVPGSAYRPDWAKQDILRNATGSEMCYTRSERDAARKEGRPLRVRSKAELSFDRAFDQLIGRVPGSLVSKWKDGQKNRVHSLGWGWNEDEKAERALKRKAIEAETYIHAYKAAVSPLVWPQGHARAQSNALFTAPLLQYNQAIKARVAAAAEADED